MRVMPLAAALIAAGAVVGLGIVGGRQRSAVPSRVAWERTEYEAHPAVGDAKANAVFRFTVYGSAPIEIVHLETSGGTTTAAVDRTGFNPGESGEILATSTLGLRHGRLGDTVTVVTRTAGAEDQEHDLFFGVDIPSADQVISGLSELLVWKKGQAAQTKELRLLVKQAQPIVISTAEVDGKAFTAEVVTVAPGREYRIRIAPTATTATASSSLTIITDAVSERFKRMRIVLVVSEPAD